MRVHLIGGDDVAAELDAKRAIKQGTELAATIERITGAAGSGSGSGPAPAPVRLRVRLRVRLCAGLATASATTSATTPATPSPARPSPSPLPRPSPCPSSTPCASASTLPGRRGHPEPPRQGQRAEHADVAGPARRDAVDRSHPGRARRGGARLRRQLLRRHRPADDDEHPAAGEGRLRGAARARTCAT